MSCSIHTQWVHESSDCPLCVVSNDRYELATLRQRIDDAHNALDLFGVSRTTPGNGVFTVAGRIDALREEMAAHGIHFNKGDTVAESKHRETFNGINDRELLNLMHLLEQARLSTAWALNLNVKNVDWPPHYKDIVAEAQLRKLCL